MKIAVGGRIYQVETEAEILRLVSALRTLAALRVKA